MSGIIDQNNLWIKGYSSLMSKDRIVFQANDLVVLDSLYIALTHLDALQDTKRIFQKQKKLSPRQCDEVGNQVEKLQIRVKELCLSMNRGGVFRGQSILSVLYKIDELTEKIIYEICQLRLVCLNESEETKELYADIKDDMNILLNFGDLIRRDTSSLFEAVEPVQKAKIH